MLGRVVLFDHRKERRAEGGVAVVTYEVYSSPQAARTLYEDYFAGVRSANRFQDRGYRFRLANRDQPHTCVEETAQTWCLVVIDSVRIEASSRIRMFDPGQPSGINTMLGSALDHFDRATGGH